MEERTKKSRGMLGNALMLIRPYKLNGVWVFDEPRVQVEREPFVGDTNKIIDTLIGPENLAQAERAGFNLFFSAQPFPGYQAQVCFVREEFQGSWYRWEERNLEGWLCAAMYYFFEESPKEIFFKAEI